MGMLAFLTATRKRSFNFLTGTNQLATISDVNTAFDAINVLAKNTTQVLETDLLVTTNGFGNSFKRANGQGTTVACDSAYALCVNTGTCCGSTKAYACSNCKANAISMVETAPGEYDLVLDKPENLALYEETAIIFGQPPVPAIITVEKVDKLNYLVKVIDLATGLPTANLLENTLVTIKVYPSVAANNWLK